MQKSENQSLFKSTRLQGLFSFGVISSNFYISI